MSSTLLTTSEQQKTREPQFLFRSKRRQGKDEGRGEKKLSRYEERIREEEERRRKRLVIVLMKKNPFLLDFDDDDVIMYSEHDFLFFPSKSTAEKEGAREKFTGFVDSYNALVFRSKKS